MPKNAHQLLDKMNSQTDWLESKLKKFIPKAKIEKIIVLKDKLIIDKQYKITTYVKLAGTKPKSVILEIHDNNQYFQRSLFTLNKLKKIKIDNKSYVAKLYGYDIKNKLIVREDLPQVLLSDMLNDKKISQARKTRLIKKSAVWLYKLHTWPKNKIPAPVKQGLNLKIEDKILKRTLEFIKPNIEKYRPQIKKNLFKLLLEMKKEKKCCLVHGDFQVSNIIIDGSNMKIFDFDTLELGHPGRDLGRYTYQLKYFLPGKKYEKTKKIFLDQYFISSKFNFEEIKNNIALHQAEMIQYIILGLVWGNKIPKANEIKFLLKEQTDLLFKQI